MIESWPIHTVVLDLDDTLYPEREYVLSGFEAVDRWICATKRIQGFGARARHLFESGRRGKIFDEVLLEFGIEPHPDVIAEVVSVYREHVPALSLSSDAAEILPWLASNFNLALLTDGYAEVQRAKIASLRLSRWIECIVVTDEIGRDFWKPSHVGFERIMGRYGGTPSGFVYVGDNPKKDFIAPKHLQWQTVRITRSEGEYAASVSASRDEADVVIDDLMKLKHILIPWTIHQ
jgi:putative hydrolase of the HAD superfamily